MRLSKYRKANYDFIITGAYVWKYKIIITYRGDEMDWDFADTIWTARLAARRMMDKHSRQGTKSHQYTKIVNVIIEK